MAANAPWSVKGIDPKTREAAKEFARRSGLTLGEWLNQKIQEDGGAAEGESPPAPLATPALPIKSAPSSDLLAGLSQRMEAVEQRSTLAVTGLDQSVRGVLARLETSEQHHAEGRARLEDRLRKIEDEAAGPRSAEAIRSLETAFGKVANRVNDTEARLADNLDDMRREVVALGRRLEELERGQSALASGAHLEQRLEQIAANLTARVEAAKADMAKEVEAAGARSTGAVERIGLEVLRMAESLDRRVQSVENRSADAIEQVGGEVARAMGTLERRVIRSETIQAQALEKLGGEIARITEKLSERIGNAERRAAQAIDDVGEQVTRVTERLNSRYDRASSDLAERIRASEERTARLLEEARERIDVRLADSQRRVNDQVDRIAFSGPSSPTSPEPSTAYADPFEAPPPLVIYPDAAPFGVSTFAPPGFAAVEPEFDRVDLDAAENFATPPQSQTEADFMTPPPSQTEADFMVPPIAPTIAAAVEAAPEPTVWADEPDELQLSAPPPPRQEIAEPEMPEALSPPEPFAPEQVASLSTRQMIEQARAAARAGAQASPKIRPRDDRRHPPPTGLGALLGRKRKSNLKSGLMVSVAFLALCAAVGGYVKLADTYGLPPKVAAGADRDTSPEYKGPEADTTPRAAVALEPQPIAPEGTTAATPGPNAQALYADGAQKLEVGDKSGLALVQRAANLGLPAAQGKLGWLYDKGGAGLAENPTEARKWYERAAQAGDRLAMYNLALVYFDGRGGPKNLTVAAEWFRRAANAGLTDSQYNLGKLYEQGLGVPQNAAEAYKWYLLAARGGSEQQRAEARQAATQVGELISPAARAAAERSANEIAGQSQAAQTLAAKLNAAPTVGDLTVAQGALFRLGYFKGAADGQMSPALSLAIQSYQRDKNLPATGQLDVGTANSLTAYAR